MSKIFRIGTRDSELALWQATTVQQKLEALGHDTVLVPTKSLGDRVLDTPLYELGVTGIFTKALDLALLEGKVDLAVHSMKDVPTQLPKGLLQLAVLERAGSQDILVHKGSAFLDLDRPATIATGSLRRKAQWLNRYPKHRVVDLRGNVNSRLIKLIENPWQGAIFARAGLERINLLPKDALVLDWMLPAPAQGAVVVVGREGDSAVERALEPLHDLDSGTCTEIERDFLRTLEGGCSAPIGALAQIRDQTVYFKGGLYSLDGTQKIEVKKEVPRSAAKDLGKRSALEILQGGGDTLMQKIRDENPAVD